MNTVDNAASLAGISLATFVLGVGAWTTSTIDHLLMEVILVFFLVFCAVTMRKNARNISALLKQGELDKQAREQVLLDMRIAAEELARKTAKAVEEGERNLRDLHGKIDENIQASTNAAKASELAAEVANSVNEKIAQTNQRLVEQATLANQRLIEQTQVAVTGKLEQAVEIGKETLDTAHSVEKKVDKLVGG